MSELSNTQSLEPKIKKRWAIRPDLDLEIEEKNEEQKFLKVLALLLKKEGEEEEEIEGDSVDGITDSVISLAETLSELLECNFDTLDLPKTIIKSLKILKAITKFFKTKHTIEVFKNL